MKTLYVIAILAATLAASARAEEKTEAKVATLDNDLVNVDVIREKYWARGDEAELGVVQNRAYSKAGKAQFGVLSGLAMSDPFVNVRTTGFSLGYHFSEYVGVSALYWRDFVGGSSALTTFEEFSGATANTNLPKAYLGAEGQGSLLYGKLSVLGKAIIYYDLHATAGMGLTYTESGNYFTPSLGLGQRFYLSKNISLRFDYRIMHYNENIIEKVVPTKLGEIRGERSNWTNTVTLGLDFLFGF